MRPVVLFLLLMPACLWATEITGVVTDGETGTPVQGATIRLGDEVAAVTDELGVFRFYHVSQAGHRFRVSHIGYVAIERELGVGDRDSQLVISLVPLAIPLSEMTVEAEPVGANDIHRNPAFVTVISRESFEGREVSLPDVLAEATGVQIKRLGGLGAFSSISLRGSSSEQVEVY
ncbi:MAG: carboxypeptidase-like regulatory domain-containing protein, partial [bacterium]|nr:carboxypeptidase-like regulatory domain-containing protein [bacterium]